MVGYTYGVHYFSEQASTHAEKVALAAAGKVTRRLTGKLAANEVSGCLASTQRTVNQLQFDFVVYSSDRAAATAPGAGPAQRAIRAREASALLAKMKHIARVHIDSQPPPSCPPRSTPSSAPSTSAAGPSTASPVTRMDQRLERLGPDSPWPTAL